MKPFIFHLKEELHNDAERPTVSQDILSQIYDVSQSVITFESALELHIFSDLKNDPSRFESPGINFNAKLIGIDEISSARGDKMCQESIQRLKLAVKSSGQHKQKIIVNVSLEGVRLIDLRSQVSGIIWMNMPINFNNDLQGI